MFVVPAVCGRVFVTEREKDSLSARVIRRLTQKQASLKMWETVFVFVASVAERKRDCYSEHSVVAFAHMSVCPWSVFALVTLSVSALCLSACVHHSHSQENS